jgi:hypothetical protein
MTKLALPGICLVVAVMAGPLLAIAQTPKIPEEGALIGKFKVRCPLGHDGFVSGITRNNTCNVGGRDHPRVVKGSAMVVCPDGHPNPVGNITRSHKCWIDGKECEGVSQ